jgi:hypothetical protein
MAKFICMYILSLYQKNTPPLDSHIIINKFEYYKRLLETVSLQKYVYAYIHLHVYKRIVSLDYYQMRKNVVGF